MVLDIKAIAFLLSINPYKDWVGLNMRVEFEEEVQVSEWD